MKLRQHDETDAIIQGKSWVIRFVTRRDMPKGTYGDCNYEKQLIRVRKDVSEKKLFDTLHHEVMHAQQPWLDEQFVCESATEMANIIFATNKFDVYPRGKPLKNKKRN